MSKQTLIKAILEHTNMRTRDAGELANILLDQMKGELVAGELKLPGIGSFHLVKRAQRMGRNPKTGQPYVAPARVVVKFKASPGLIKQINGVQD